MYYKLYLAPCYVEYKIKLNCRENQYLNDRYSNNKSYYYKSVSLRMLSESLHYKPVTTVMNLLFGTVYRHLKRLPCSRILLFYEIQHNTLTFMSQNQVSLCKRRTRRNAQIRKAYCWCTTQTTIST